MRRFEELNATLPKHNDMAEDPIVYAKVFHTVSPWNWYILSYENGVYYAFVTGDENEIGCVSFGDFQEPSGPFARFELDVNFKPITLSKLMDQVSE